MNVSTMQKMFAWTLLLFISTACGQGASDKTQRSDNAPSAPAAKVSVDGDIEGAGAKTAAEEKIPKVEKILVVLVDALRADKLGCYGFDEPTSPAIDKLAKESILFEQVHAASPWTAPSFGTLFTGVSPMVHGAGKMLGRNGSGGKEVHGVTVGGLRNDLPTLAELLPKNMRKGAVINNSFVCRELGFAKGFDDFDFKIARLTQYRTADEVTDIAIQWLDENGSRPFFYFLHYFDPHIQYAPPKKYLPQFAPNRPPRIAYPFTDHAGARDGSLNPTEAEKAFIRGLYHGEVRFVDDELSRLLAHMDKLKLLDDTWIVFISDHGEELFEHGSFDHGHRYEEEVVRVPWIIRAPGGAWKAGTRIAANVSHVDFFATLLDMAKVDLPAHAEGKSVLPMIAGDDTASRVSYMEYNLFRGQQCAMFDGRRKIIYDIRRESAFGYDLKVDPAEQQRLSETTPEIEKLKKMMFEKRNTLEQVMKDKSHNNATLSDESRDALKSLGYIE
ncbi:MAG: sulfatase [Deltaproteobacteria bacterium]|nr:sulfatase [Deltaproteobacteria bacterium]MBN2674335.1 sulfatase [Deltaproteobacteria bacterium]